MADNQRSRRSVSAAREAVTPAKGHKDTASAWDNLAREGVILTRALLGAPWCAVSSKHT